MDADLASIAEARDLLRRARVAFDAYRGTDQARVDRIAFAAVEAGYAAAERLAAMALEESGLGRLDGKIAKNRFATRGLWTAIREMRTCGIVREDAGSGVTEIADPFGVVAAVMPITNPTSTALFKSICCLKSRNAMVASPHPRASACVAEAVRIASEAAIAEGAPKDLLLCMTHVSLEGTRELMRHSGTDLILATGGSGLVREAYSSGKPAFGVGPGNVPVWVDRSADVVDAARCIVAGQTFDNGTLCSSEQAIIADRPIASALRDALVALGARWCSPEETRKLEAIVLRGRDMNPAIVGQSAAKVAALAGFEVPPSTTVLLAAGGGTGTGYPLSHEKLCPLLAWYEVDGHEAGCRLAIDILKCGGLGHTLGLHCRDESVIRAFGIEKPVNRIVVNSPTSQGAVGFSTGLFPSLTLGCGSFGGNITSDNVGPQHLVNLKRLARVRPEFTQGTLRAEWPASPPSEALRTPPKPWGPIFTASPPAAAAPAVAETKPPPPPEAPDPSGKSREISAPAAAGGRIPPNPARFFRAAGSPFAERP